MSAIRYELIKTDKQTGARLGKSIHRTAHLIHLCLCQLARLRR